MKIDIHRHAKDQGTAQRVVRNLFHSQADEMESGKYYSIGLHPWHVKANTLDSDIALVSIAAGDPRIIAIGEAGLDKTIRVPMEIQQKALKAQVEIALEVDKPLIIHCVRSYNEIFSLKSMSSSDKPWIIHWFNASPEMGEQLIRDNFYLSFGHMLFNPKSKAYKAFQQIPEHHLFLETDDAGYTIDEIYQQASLIKGLSLSKLESLIRTNFITCFEIKP